MVLLYTAPAFVIIISWIFFGERISLIQVCGALLIIFSLFITSSGRKKDK